MNTLNPDTEQEHIKRIEQGEVARKFLESAEWTQLVKPIIDSMLMGLKDITNVDDSSDKKAALEIKSRKLAADFISKIQLFIEGFVSDGDMSRKYLERVRNSTELYKVNE